MTEQGSPLSRRERRAMEARAAGAAPDPTEALEGMTDDPNPPTDGLSRRDRRRIERAQRPLETWTQEEEMIATGQLPAMTPEVIAEQDRIAQQKAADAAADEAAAIAAQGADGGAFTPVSPDGNTDGRGSTLPVRTSAFARAADADVEYQDDASEPEPDTEAPAEFTFEPDADAEPEVHAEPDAEAHAEPQPDWQPEPGPQATFEPAPESESPDGDEDGIPEAFRGMFPPGSLQARAMAARRQDHDTERADVHTESGAAPGAGTAAEGDAAEEIRRLTAAAIAGIEGSASRHHESQPSEQDQWAGEQSAPQQPANDEPANDEPANDEPANDEPANEEPVQDPTHWNEFGGPAEVDQESGAAPVASDFWQQPADAARDHFADASTTAPHHTSFDDVIAARSGELPLAEQLVDPDALVVQAPDNPTVAPSIWDAHPLDATDSRARELADAPSQAIPRPDFSALAPATNPEHPAPFSPTAYVTGEPPLTTGSIEVARRKVPELHPAGGARHFRWAHIAVLGAIAFVLGVLVWNLVGQAS